MSISAKTLSQKLREKSMVMATAESCTGGLISAAITDLAGSSSVFDRGYITYSNDSKMELLGVSRETLGEHGAVSPQVASEMAQGALKNSNAQIAVSVTGIAGPDGGTKEKPIGLVYIGIATKDNVTTYKNNFDGNRAEIRTRTVEKALSLIIDKLDSVE